MTASSYRLVADGVLMCKACGTIVVDRPQHDLFHNMLDGLAAVADAYPSLTASLLRMNEGQDRG